MSLEAQITALVEASNKLTSAVDGKIVEIDNKVDKATASVPSTIHSMSQGSYYVDCRNGLDSNDGTISRPFKNISAIVNKTIPGGRYYIYLSAGEHYVDDISFNGNVYLTSRTDMNQYRVSDAIANSRPIDLSIYTKITIRKSANKTARIRGYGVVSFYNCLISHDLNEGEYAASGSPVGFVHSCVVESSSVQLSISGYESNDYDVPLSAISGYGGNTISSIGFETLAVKGKINKVIGGNSSAKGVLAIASNTFINRAVKSGGSTPSDLYVASDFRGVVGS